MCSLCKRDGHLKKDCPEDFKKVELEPLPPMTQDFLRVLNKVCEKCYSKFNNSYNLFNTVLSFASSSKYYKFIYLQRDLITNKVIVWLSLFLDDFAPDKLEVGVREHILKDLENFVKRQFPGNTFFVIISLGFSFLKCNFITFQNCSLTKHLFLKSTLTQRLDCNYLARRKMASASGRVTSTSAWSWMDKKL